MICRTCLRRAAGLTTRPLTTPRIARPIPTTAASTTRPFTTTLPSRNASPSPSSSAPAATTEPSTPATTDKPELTPLTPATPEFMKAGAASSCPEGTVLNGLNYHKGKKDPVALADAAYPAWLWDCLEVQKKAGDGAGAEAGDEFCTAHPKQPPQIPPPPPS